MFTPEPSIQFVPATREQVVAIPELEGDVHDLRTLAELAEALFGQPLTPAPRLARRA